MANFQAQEREVGPAVAPADVPYAYEGALRHVGDNATWPRQWRYADKKHTELDFLRPGYFRKDARDQLRVGDEIHYTMYGGAKLPSEAQRGIAVVEELPSSREIPMILAIVQRFGRGTPVRHAGEADDRAKPNGRKE